MLTNDFLLSFQFLFMIYLYRTKWPEKFKFFTNLQRNNFENEM